MSDTPTRRQGLVVRAAKGEARDPVVETRVLIMPDGTPLVCRRRETPGRWSRWTAEVPLDVAKQIFAAD